MAGTHQHRGAAQQSLQRTHLKKESVESGGLVCRTSLLLRETQVEKESLSLALC